MTHFQISLSTFFFLASNNYRLGFGEQESEIRSKLPVDIDPEFLHIISTGAGLENQLYFKHTSQSVVHIKSIKFNIF